MPSPLQTWVSNRFLKTGTRFAMDSWEKQWLDNGGPGDLKEGYTSGIIWGPNRKGEIMTEALDLPNTYRRPGPGE